MRYAGETFPERPSGLSDAWERADVGAYVRLGVMSALSVGKTGDFTDVGARFVKRRFMVFGG